MRHPRSQQYPVMNDPLPQPNGEALFADFVVCKQHANAWEVSLATQRAFHWISPDHADRFDGESGKLRMTLAETNALMSEIRKAGLRIRYQGPNKIEML